MLYASTAAGPVEQVAAAVVVVVMLVWAAMAAETAVWVAAVAAWGRAVAAVMVRMALTASPEEMTLP
jgi:hypothetical protein